MRVLVTGGAGFIGSHLCERLLLDGHSVTVVDNLSTGVSSNLQMISNSSNFTFIEGSILDSQLLFSLMRSHSCEIIFGFHLGTRVKKF